MNYNSHTLSTLFDKSLIRITTDFGSEKDPRSVCSELTKELKTKVSSNDPGAYNFQLTRGDDGVYSFVTPFMLYRDSRLVIISLFKWIERSGVTNRNNNLFIDLKFIDAIEGPFKGTLFNTSTKIDNIDKLRFILEFDEESVYNKFPSRKSGNYSNTILNLEPRQKFIPRENSDIDPSLYVMPDTSNSGINFERLNQGFLRMQYLGGEGYQKKIEAVLEIINQFCVTSWDCVINKNFTRNNILKFEKVIEKKKKVRESYLDYELFKANFPKIKLSIDLVYLDKTITAYYPTLRDKLYDILNNMTFKGEIDINYDTTLAKFQMKEGDITNTKSLNNIEFVLCKCKNGTYTNCDFYDTTIDEANLEVCNLFLHSKADKCNINNSFTNRTSEIINCDFGGMNGVLNGKMEGGIFRTGKIGNHSKISNNTDVIEYQQLKSGFLVSGDKVIVPTKKYRKE